MNMENDWTVTCNRYVAFLDIMGFKDMVTRMTHDEVYEMMKKIDKSRKHVENVDWLKTKLFLAKSTTYSDSIIVYSKDESYEAFDFLVSTVAGLTNYLFLEGVPHKGALAFGMMTLDTENSIYFGQPLIDAYILQEEINFYGVLMHASVEQELSTKTKKMPMFTKHYLCPLKSGNANHYTIYPLYATQKNSPKYEADYTKLIDSINKLRLKTSGHLRKYIDNTEIYLKGLSK
jgi:hypothetical protein